MKKIFFAAMVAAATLCVERVSAQSLQSLFEGFAKMLTEQSDAPSQQAKKVAYPTAKEIVGKWAYQQLVMEYTGDSSLASLAVSSAATQLPTLATKAGLAAGKDYVRVKSDGKILFVSGEKKVEGSYTYVPPTGQMIVTVNYGEHSVTLTGSVSKVDGKLKVLFKANEVVAKAEMISSKIQENSTFAILKELINSYPGIMGGALFSK